MSKKIRKVIGIAAPVVASFIPGIGPLAAAGIGAAGGALAGGGLKGALLGAVTGGAGKYLAGSGALGFANGTPLALTSGNAALAGPTQGTGLLGSLTRGTSILSNAFKGGLSGSGGGNLLNSASNILSAVKSYGTQDDLEDELLEAQGKARGAIAPYSTSGLEANSKLSERLRAGYTTGDIANDPSYKFRLSEGQKAIERALSASGSLNSGAALKAAQEYGQGLASEFDNERYDRWQSENNALAQQSGQGFDAAGQMGDSYINEGDISSNADVAKNNIFNSALSTVLQGSGSRKVIGYDRDGKPIYADGGI